MDQPLPDFENPPVVEVALGIQFDPLTGLQTPQLGLLWQKFRDSYPRIEEHAPLEPIVERFGRKVPSKIGIELKMMAKPPVPRCWFLNQAGTELIQVQQDRFIHNWRKRSGEEPYPRYPHVRSGFEADLDKFEQFAAAEGLGPIKPTLCEVLYVNHIESGKGWTRHGELPKILELCRLAYSEGLPPEPEELRMAGSFLIPGVGDEPAGRLRFDIEPGYRRSDEHPAFRLNVMARGRPDGEGIEGVLRFMDKGREWVVRGFTALTSAEMHKVWGRRS